MHSLRQRPSLRALLAFLPVLFLLQIPSLQQGYAQSSSQVFPETGKTVSGKFLDYWNIHGGLQQQGFPISGEMQEKSATDGKVYTVQYFERAVFELHPGNQPPYDVLLSLLGASYLAQKYPNGAPGQVPNTSPGSVLFKETGHRVGGWFLDYWQSHGGLAQQGYPLTDEFKEVSPVDGKEHLVQYFERAVFELHPGNQPPYNVLLSLLGSLQYKALYDRPSPTATPKPAPPPPPPPSANTGGDWPTYGHDAGHTSTNPDETLVEADNVGQLVQRWQVNTGTNGTPSSSTPSISGGRVYVGSSAASGPNFFALDAQTGATAWAVNLGYAQGCSGVGIGSTPAISGTTVVVGGGDPGYYGLDANSGARLWRESIDVGPSSFAWESPLLAHGRAYIGVSSDCDNPSVRGELRAVDLKDGHAVASLYIVPEGQAGGGIWHSPALSEDGGTLFIATGEDFNGYNGPLNRALVALDPLSMSVKQANKQGITDVDEDFASSPTVFRDRAGRALVGAGHKNGIFYAYALGAIDQGPIWSQQVKYQIGVLPAYDPGTGNGGTLFLTGSDGFLHAVDPASGANRWPPALVGQLFGNIAVANGLVFANAGKDGLKILNESTGQVIRTLMPPHAGDTYSGVAIAHGFIYWAAGGYLNAWGLP